MPPGASLWPLVSGSARAAAGEFGAPASGRHRAGARNPRSSRCVTETRAPQTRSAFAVALSPPCEPPPGEMFMIGLSAHPPGMKVRAGMLRPGVAGTAWNAGFSRHSPPQAGGGTDLIRRDGAAAPPSTRVTTNRPRPCGPLCRLKPAFQPARNLAGGQPRTTALSQELGRCRPLAGIARERETRVHRAASRKACGAQRRQVPAGTAR